MPRPRAGRGYEHTERVSFLITAKHALVICNGEAPSKKLARQLVRNADVIVAADGGANVARKLGVRPDVIIGDLDSIKPATRRYFSSGSKGKWLNPLAGSSIIDYPRPSAKETADRKGRSTTLPYGSIDPKGRRRVGRLVEDYIPTEIIEVRRQDNTDLEKALDFLLEDQIKRATIIAATGKRLDHTLGNLSAIWNYTNSIAITFISDGWLAVPVGRKRKIRADVGTTVSLLPFGVCSGITLKGLHYPLNNATMKVGEIGISNVVAKSPFTVAVKKGSLLMMILADNSRIEVLR